MNSFLASHAARRSGERKRRLERGHLHAETFFGKRVVPDARTFRSFAPGV